MAKKTEEKNQVMEELVSLCKRRGFIFQGSEIYGGLAGTWDYGPLGVSLKENIRRLWWKRFVLDRDDMYGVDASILMNPKVWVATGHVGGFADPLVNDMKTGKRYRADHLLEDAGIDVRGMKLEDMAKIIKEKGIKSPEGNLLGEVRQFNMMFKTHVGAMQDETSISYLRPETAQGMFVNFKNVMDSLHPKLPFGLAQIGKAFRNEIAPRDFTFRSREFEQMEIEYFVNPKEWERVFNDFVKEVHAFNADVGIQKNNVHENEISDADRAFYSKRTIDFEFDFPFGRKELYGLAYRTDYDLSAHGRDSGMDLSYLDEDTKERFIPHCIEPSFGLDRTLLAVLSSAYTKEVVKEGDERVVMRFSPKVAPVLVAVSPLLRNKPVLVEKAEAIFKALKKEFGRVMYDDNGNIGKRYRRQDEIGTPFCVVVDFDTVEKDECVTIRDRDSMKQERIKISEISSYLHGKLD